MKENIELARNREFGDIISDTFVVIRQNFKPLMKAYFVICGLFLLANILISALINTNRDDPDMQTLIGFSELFFVFINYTALMLTTQAYFILYKEKGNQPPAVLEVWGYFRYYFFRVFITQFILFIAMVIGFFLCFLPFIYLSVVFSLVTPIMVNENGSIEYSIKKSFKVINGNWWFTFGAVLLMGIIATMMIMVLLVPSIMIYGSAEWLSGKNLGYSAGIVESVVLNFCQLLWVIPYTAITLIYYSLIEEKEGSSLVNRINSFGKSSRGTDQISEQY